MCGFFGCFQLNFEDIAQLLSLRKADVCAVLLFRFLIIFKLFQVLERNLKAIFKKQ